MPPNLTGYYRFVSQKNLEDYLQALNIGLALRKIALLLKPDKEIEHQGNHMTVKTVSTFQNYVLEFEVGVEFEEDLKVVDGRKCQSPSINCLGRGFSSQRYLLSSRLKFQLPTRCFPSAGSKVKPKVIIFLRKPIPAFIFTISINGKN
ncbi:retinol-binding protein 5 isoform X1 [Vicugna pacos]|uniref:Retinol-binding protein 5 isoform X1 n=1 Tax=Vicugna pacos TaxID=30538 RepID=A0ABM5CNT3_VICPA